MAKVKAKAVKNKKKFLTAEQLQWFKDVHAYTNYLGAASLYLKDNFLMEKPLDRDQIKERILGHWGTVPGLNFIYAHANFIVSRYKQEAIFITGPGHGAPAILAGNFLDGTMGDFYRQYSHDGKGMGQLIKDFSWPYKLPSHVTPDVPGSILEGGELGYSLSTAYGAVMDNPKLVAFCVIGDGEAESGPLAASWHSNKFLNPAESGAVLPILHVNGYKINSPTVYSTMSNEELTDLFKGFGYKPYIVEGDPDVLHEEMARKMDEVYRDIQEIWRLAREEGKVMRVKWPMIVLRSMKGWTCVRNIAGKRIEDNFRSHGIPLGDPVGDPEQFRALKGWLESYKIRTLVDGKGRPLPKLMKYLPKGDLRMGKCKYAYGGRMVKNLSMPRPEKFEFRGEHGEVMGQNTRIATDWLNQVFVEDKKKNRSLRFFCPDETASNKMGKLFEGGGREYLWPVKPEDENIFTSGRVSELLSEHTMLGHLLGYILTGRHGMFASYESFAMVNVSMIDQHCKFIKQAKRIKWRKPIASLNYLLTSNCWRQEHNGFSHQNVGFISNALERHGDFVSVYFPPDANSLMVTWEQNLKSRNRVNVVVAGKTDLPQWLSVKEARRQFADGVMVWDWIDPDGTKDPDVVFAATGDYMIEEVAAAVDILRHEIPEFKTRFVCVSELTSLGLGTADRPLDNAHVELFEQYFGKTQPIIYNFHGYAITIRKLLFGHPHADRFCVHGYNEEGSTTTPFDMQVRNETSRFHLVIDALQRAGINNAKYARKARALVKKYQKKLVEHKKYVLEHGADLPEVVHWKWDN